MSDYLINQDRLDRLVVQTYKYVKGTVSPVLEYNYLSIVTYQIMSLCKSLGIPYSEDYFKESIAESYNRLIWEGKYVSADDRLYDFFNNDRLR